jgi:hypothetical protein
VCELSALMTKEGRWRLEAEVGVAPHVALLSDV